MTNKNLLDAPSNRDLKILAIQAGTVAKKRLISMGVHIGDMITKYNGNKWGPVLIKNITLNASKLAICKGLAHSIVVEYEET